MRVPRKQGDNVSPMLLRKISLTCDKMTVEQRKQNKTECEESILRINSEHSSDSLNPEERHKLLILRCNIKNELGTFCKVRRRFFATN